MKYLLDTNVCIEYLRKRNPLLTARMSGVPQQDKYLCPIVLGELYFGAYRSARPLDGLAQVEAFARRFVILPFDERAAQKYGELRADLSSRGQIIGPYDLQIAAIALIQGVTLVTHNTREFSRVTGLSLDDWAI